MNCATHSDIAAVAFCRTCGKPLCNQCTRDVRGVIYCEACLAARMEGTAPPAGFVPPQAPPQTGYQQFMDQGLGVRVQPGPASGPNPTVAGILGAIPLGLGAVYCGQYAKGLAHLGIVVLAIVGLSSDLPWQADMVLGIFLGFFWVYQILDAVRTAKAIQAGEPAPDPFGLAQTFGTGEKFETTKVPAAAAILIGLGVLFLINTVFDFSLHRFWPIILIVLGVWLFAKHWGLLGTHRPFCVCEHCRTRKLMGPAILITLGVLFLLDNVGRFEFHRTWPAILLVIGVVKLMQSNASSEGHIGPLPPGMPPSVPPGSQNFSPPPSAPQNPEQTASSGEVKNV
jgi:cell wall-active antibiotic response 4TMS protein YvqF/B-box zinc finger protein